MATEAELLCANLPSSVSPAQSSSYKQNPGWTVVLMAAAVSTTVGCAIPFGYNISVINTPSHIIKLWCNASIAPTVLSDTQLDLLWSSVVSVYIVGGMIGSLIASWCADCMGRKGSLVISDVLTVVSAVMFFVCKPLSSVPLLFLARLIAGLSSGLTLSVMPMYLMELAPDSKRGAVGVLVMVGVTSGVLLGQIMGLNWILGTEANWHLLLSLYLVLTLVSAVALPVIPESPKYLYNRGNKQLAISELARLRACSVAEVMEELEVTPDERPWSVISLLSTSNMRLPLALVCALQAGQQFSGINAVFFYSSYIFRSVGLSETECQYATLCTGFVNFGISVVMIPVVNCCRRRPLIQLSCVLSILMLLLLCVTIFFMGSVLWLGYISILSVLLYVLFYGFGLGPIPVFIGSELFDVGPRPAAMALGSASNWTGNLFVGLAFPLLNQWIHEYVFLIFATATAALVTFISLKLPETFKQRSEHQPRNIENGG